jgi:hypothetical protein
MDVDGKKGDEQTNIDASGNQLPTSGQHHAGGAIQQGEGAGSVVLQSKQVKPGNKPVIALSHNGGQQLVVTSGRLIWSLHKMTLGFLIK